MFSIDLSNVSVFIRPFVVWLFALLGLSGLSGCQALQTDKLLDTMQGATVSAVERMGSDSLGQFQVGGQAINPAVVAKASLTYSVSVGYDGLAGQFQAAGAGKLDRPVDQDQLLKIYRDSSLSAEQKNRMILEVLARTAPAPAAPEAAAQQ